MKNSAQRKPGFPILLLLIGIAIVYFGLTLVGGCIPPNTCHWLDIPCIWNAQTTNPGYVACLAALQATRWAIMGFGMLVAIIGIMKY